jgi:hypothetical protein
MPHHTCQHSERERREKDIETHWVYRLCPKTNMLQIQEPQAMTSLPRKPPYMHVKLQFLTEGCYSESCDVWNSGDRMSRKTAELLYNKKKLVSFTCYLIIIIWIYCIMSHFFLN